MPSESAEAVMEPLNPTAEGGGWQRVVDSIQGHYSLVEPNIFGIGLIGMLGFPAYYFIWSHLYPQPYENLGLRMVGSLLFSGLVFSKYLPKALKGYLPIYWHLSLLFALPFFFTFMLLANGGNTVWLMSLLVATVLMVLVLDWVNMVVHFVVGSLMAVAAYMFFFEEWALPDVYGEHLPIYLFLVVAASVFSYTKGLVAREKRATLSKTGASIAHELRTPLLGMRAGVSSVREYLPQVVEGYRLADEYGLPVPPEPKARLNKLEPVLGRVERQIDDATAIIDMLLFKAGCMAIRPRDYGYHSAVWCVEEALARYPYRSDRERKMVRVGEREDFRFYGSDLLLMHVVFNLLKNAIYFVAKADKGGDGWIEITTHRGHRTNEVRVRDTGTGIEADRLEKVFDWFYSRTDNDTSTGIGLAFVKAVMEGFGGAVTCHSELGRYAEFVLTFPRVNGNEE